MAKRKIYVLIACEESQAECSEFRKAGFVAFSCDLQKCGRNANPSWHIRGDVVPFLYGRYEFKTMDGKRHKVPRWDLIVAHPPCTYLCKLSSVQLTKAGVLDRDRYMKLIEAREFFLVCLNALAPFVAVENPLPMAKSCLPPPSCFADPAWYGYRYHKKTLYWTKNLPPLFAQVVNPDATGLVRSTRSKWRARTAPNLAHALVDQWGVWVKDHLEETL